MAITNYAELKDAVANWLARSGDPQITGNAADFITMAECHINRNLRVRQMETVMTFTTTSGATNLADDYLAWRSMTLLGADYVPLEYLTPAVFGLYTPEAGIPRYFTIAGTNIKIHPTDDATSVEFLYYAKVPYLVSDTDTNWLLTEHPDLYLAASLAEANAFLLNPDHSALWGQKRDSIIGQMAQLSEKTKGPSRMIPVGAIY